MASPWSVADGSGESELWRGFRGFRRFGRPYRFGRFAGRRRWAYPWGRVWGGVPLPVAALPPAPPQAVVAPDAGAGDAADSSDGSEEFALQGELDPENEGESEFWRRPGWRRGFRRFGRFGRRRRFLRWRRRAGMVGSGGSTAQSGDTGRPIPTAVGA